MLSIEFADGTVLDARLCFGERWAAQDVARQAVHLVLADAPRSLDTLKALYEDPAKTAVLLVTNLEADPVDAASYTGYTVPLGIGVDEELHCAWLRLGRLQRGELIQPLLNELLAQMADETAAERYALLFEGWAANTHYRQGDRREYGGWLFRCLQDHTSQGNWTPDAAPALWVNIVDPGEEYPLIDNPIRAENPWMEGEKGRTADGARWVSRIDNNVWQPTDFPAGWRQVE